MPGLSRRHRNAKAPTACAIGASEQLREPDQLEVARHVEVAGAGTRVPPKKLTPARLRAAVAGARERRAGAERIAQAFRAAGGPVAAADALESLLPGRTRVSTAAK
jgi:UDP:flavonoid glycosyltransferase YjiC (YdhE family)